MFGHAHEPKGVQLVEGVLFSNAAMTCDKTAANVIDFYVGAQRQQRVDNIKPQYSAQQNNDRCSVM